MEQKLNEQDLDNLINQHLNDCKGYAEVCALTATDEGRRRVVDRIKQMVVNDGITSIEACLAQLESELRMSV